MEQNSALLQFPCDFPIKVMGRPESGFEHKARTIVQRHLPDFKEINMRSVESRQGNYRSLTFRIRATSQAQLDALYRELTSCDEMLMVL